MPRLRNRDTLPYLAAANSRSRQPAAQSGSNNDPDARWRSVWRRRLIFRCSVGSMSRRNQRRSRCRRLVRRVERTASRIMVGGSPPLTAAASASRIASRNAVRRQGRSALIPKICRWQYCHRPIVKTMTPRTSAGRRQQRNVEVLTICCHRWQYVFALHGVIQPVRQRRDLPLTGLTFAVPCAVVA